MAGSAFRVPNLPIFPTSCLSLDLSLAGAADRQVVFRSGNLCLPGWPCQPPRFSIVTFSPLLATCGRAGWLVWPTGIICFLSCNVPASPPCWNCPLCPGMPCRWVGSQAPAVPPSSQSPSVSDMRDLTSGMHRPTLSGHSLQKLRFAVFSVDSDMFLKNTKIRCSPNIVRSYSNVHVTWTV